jgi:tellurite resistance protein TerC
MTAGSPACAEAMALKLAYQWARRIAITILGFSVLVVGIAMLVLPGPALIVIPVGLGILGLEYAWARVWLKRVKQKGEELARQAMGKPPR